MNSRLYRKEQNKLITLHANSHHRPSTKSVTVRNLYDTARLISSNDNNIKYSTNLVDKLLLNNGYSQRVLDNIQKKTRKPKSRKQDNTDKVTLKLPYINDHVSRLVRQTVCQSGLPIRVVETPGRRLRDVLTDSRPLDKRVCSKNNCEAKRDLVKGSCITKRVVYQITCKLCDQKYVGETSRPLHDRYYEHYRSAANPTAASYKDKPLGKHHRELHADISKPNLELKILDFGKNLTNLKIKEAKQISIIKPELNEKTELVETKRFLVI